MINIPLNITGFRLILAYNTTGSVNQKSEYTRKLPNDTHIKIVLAMSSTILSSILNLL